MYAHVQLINLLVSHCIEKYLIPMLGYFYEKNLTRFPFYKRNISAKGKLFPISFVEADIYIFVKFDCLNCHL